MRRMATDSMTVKINPNDKPNPIGKLADAELHFTGGPLEGLKLIGFGIWERRGPAARTVSFPARQYSVNGERRTFRNSGLATARSEPATGTATRTRKWHTENQQRETWDSIACLVPSSPNAKPRPASQGSL